MFYGCKMPELRSGVHHGRAPAVDKRQCKNQVTGKKSEHLVGNFVKTRAAAVVKEEAKAKAKARAAEVAPRRGWGARLVEGAAKNGKGKEEEVIVVSEGTMVEGGEREGGFLPEEKVQVGGSPMDKIDRKLGYGHARAEFVGCVEYFRTIEWIMEQWEKNYYISSIAGANDGSSLVVMSKGTQYSQQFYKVSDSFPFKWINKKWREGFHVTSMATAGTRWAVVMSRNTGCSDLVELLLFNFVFVFSLQRLGYLVERRLFRILRYEYYYALLRDFPDLRFTINGGINGINEILMLS
ncbi:hypothetical protein RHGRI_034049 [Rhododendron griersonianum]|uniref:DUF7477 domain-containing protein n=1 Tax=Rhododendron griersonianum TaxID=479676 RepID=A0AAV6HZZ0_9ERIC|nr:hypothetical protein RHGRI_034049 [Rhododendron griersonianum]